MGVAGSGKTTIGRLLAEQLQKPFFDADDYHSGANKAKMAAGKPLDEGDREPWLQRLAQRLKTWDKKGGAVLACSALKEKYRQQLSSCCTELVWVFLHGDEQLLEQRMLERQGHFMPYTLLASQLAILEEPSYGIHLDISLPPDQIVDEIIKQTNNNG